MNAVKQSYVAALRNNTAYPVYRGIIGVITTILMIIAVLDGIGALIVGFTAMSQSAATGIIALLLGVAFAVLAFFMAKFWKEAAEIGADIADSLIDANSQAGSMSAPSAAAWSNPTSIQLPTPGTPGFNNP